MGDGRYYSYHQFFSVVILMIVAMYTIETVARLAIRKKKEAAQLGMIGFLMLLAKIIEQVIPSLMAATYVRHFTGAFIALWGVAVHAFLLNERRSISMKGFRHANLLIIGSITVLTIATQHAFFVQNNAYPFEAYSTAYVYYFMVMVLLVVINQGFKPVHYDALPLAAFILLGASVLGFLPGIDYYESIFMASLISLLRTHQTADETSENSVRFFDKMADLITDYVLVADLNGKVIYRNRRITESAYFTEVSDLTDAHLLDLFEGNKKTLKSYKGKEYIQVAIHDEIRYYHVLKQTMLKEREGQGYMYTFVDITDVMNLLFRLEQQKGRSLDLNAQLRNYSSVVYQLEKEREIKNLLDDIIAVREDEMTRLIKTIDELILSTSTDDACVAIDALIQKNAQILEDVRSVVASYRTYFGGQYD